MRVDNDGEGGILALMSLLGVKRPHRPVIIAFGLFVAALIYGDGAITPAISVVSALECWTSYFQPSPAMCFPFRS
jgi:KUP system potassium uptake protein